MKKLKKEYPTVVLGQQTNQTEHLSAPKDPHSCKGSLSTCIQIDAVASSSLVSNHLRSAYALKSVLFIL